MEHFYISPNKNMNVTISYFLHVQVSWVYKYIAGTNYTIWYNYLSYDGWANMNYNL